MRDGHIWNSEEIQRGRKRFTAEEAEIAEKKKQEEEVKTNLG
jgi:hypothetical protein